MGRIQLVVDIELIASMVGVTFEWTPRPPNDGGWEDGGGGGPFLISCLMNVDLRFNEIFGKSLRLKVIEDFHINEVMNNH